MPTKPDIKHRGYTASWSEYTGAYAIYKDGSTVSCDWGKNEEVVKEKINEMCGDKRWS
jgi:hypothetical protein